MPSNAFLSEEVFSITNLIMKENYISIKNCIIMSILQFFGDHCAPSQVTTYHTESSPTALFAYKPENSVQSNTYMS